MNELEWIIQGIESAYRGNHWNLTSLQEILKGIDHHLASVRPFGQCNSIWELLLQMRSQIDVARICLNGRQTLSLEEADFSHTESPTKDGWAHDLATFEQSMAGLLHVLRRSPGEFLGRQASSLNTTIRDVLVSTMWQNVFYAGQISLLKQAHARRSIFRILDDVWGPKAMSSLPVCY